MSKLLVVVDMQNDFIDGALGNAQCRAVVPEVVKVIEEGEYTDILLTRDTHQETYLDTQEGRNLPVVHCVEGTQGWQVHPEVLVAVEKQVKPLYFDKPAFGSVNLMRWLAEHVTAEDEIDFVGVCTGICVISNAMLAKAAVPETRIRVLAHACACVTPESHATALDAMRLCQIEIA